MHPPPTRRARPDERRPADRARRGVAFFVAACLLAPTTLRADDGAAWAALATGNVVLLRHATAPGIGDPPGFRLDDCATQRNLDDRGRAEARRIGDAFRAHGVRVGAVATSRWCRARETAALAFPDEPSRDDPAFDSFFDDASDAAARTTAARAVLERWAGPGTLVVVTHQVNVTALTGVVPASGEAVVVRVRGKRLDVVGRPRIEP